MVERQFVRSTREDTLSWEGPIPSAIMARNQKLATGCSSFEAARRPAGAPVQTGEVAGEVLDIPALAPQHLPCLRLSLAAGEPATLEVALPNARTGAYEPGRVLRYQVPPGSQTIGFVLPDYVAGSSIRLEMGETVSLSAVEIGEIERPLARLGAPALTLPPSACKLAGEKLARLPRSGESRASSRA